MRSLKLYLEVQFLPREDITYNTITNIIPLNITKNRRSVLVTIPRYNIMPRKNWANHKAVTFGAFVSMRIYMLIVKYICIRSQYQFNYNEGRRTRIIENIYNILYTQHNDTI